MRARVPVIAIAGLLAGAASPAVAELGRCKREALEAPLCGSSKGAALVVRDTVSRTRNSRWPGAIRTRTLAR
jgi:hypothetical protein